ncbi:unnamed protein product [Schistocephalus solidus]|uniref:Reverse transcriptase domain-containing protein n=1 Tax=Schistocephalus solidus TaxID=70667 RepID=A0A183T3P0_SCHSO|nr:unnamed protein product [Schistocephalus solidus]
MMARIKDNGTLSEAFAVTNGVEQGSVLAPNHFSLMLIAMMMEDYLAECPGVGIVYRTDEHFNSACMQTPMRLSTAAVHDLLIAGGCAFKTMTDEDMQRSTDVCAAGLHQLRTNNQHGQSRGSSTVDFDEVHPMANSIPCAAVKTCGGTPPAIPHQHSPPQHMNAPTVTNHNRQLSLMKTRSEVPVEESLRWVPITLEDVVGPQKLELLRDGIDNEHASRELTLGIGRWNARTFIDSDTLSLTAHSLYQYKVYVCCLSDVRIPDSGARGPTHTSLSTTLADATLLDLFVAACDNFGLRINTEKTVVMHQPPPNTIYTAAHTNVNGAKLKFLDTYTYLGSNLYPST